MFDEIGVSKQWTRTSRLHAIGQAPPAIDVPIPISGSCLASQEI
jgi:hypothetical protein